MLTQKDGFGNLLLHTKRSGTIVLWGNLLAGGAGVTTSGTEIQTTI